MRFYLTNACPGANVEDAVNFILVQWSEVQPANGEGHDLVDEEETFILQLQVVDQPLASYQIADAVSPHHLAACILVASVSLGRRVYKIFRLTACSVSVIPTAMFDGVVDDARGQGLCVVRAVCSFCIHE